MVKRTLKNGTFQQAPPAFEANRVGFAVGDIHGRADLLKRMLERLDRERTELSAISPLLVFLGDYIDRGPSTPHVIDLLLTSIPPGFEVVYLKGNHEAAMLSFLAGEAGSRAWLTFGGLETLVSYGVAPPSIGASEDTLSKTREALAAALPEAHEAFLRALELYRVAGDYLFVHAGVNAELSLEQQTERDLLWTRAAPDAGKFFPLCVVHGHTPLPEPILNDRRIAIDTGAYVTGVLTAVRLVGTRAEIIQVRE